MKNIHRYILVGMVLMGGVVSEMFAEIDDDIDLTLIANTAYSSTKIRDRAGKDEWEHWMLSGSGKLRYTLSGKGKKVKGQVRVGIIGDSYTGSLLELSRAYLRTRVPIGANYNLQIEMGKNSLTWGEGNYYNAGDVIFGADPKVSNVGGVQGGESEYRDFAFWQIKVFVPINAFSYFETVMGLPDQEYQVYYPNASTSTDGGATNTGTDAVAGTDTGTGTDSSATTNAVIAPSSDIEKSGAGARIHLEAGPLQLETGVYSRFVAEQVSPYISIALPLVVRLYVASAMDIHYDAEAEDWAAQRERYLGLSGGALYILGIGNGGTFSLQGEALYKNNITKLQLNTAMFFNRSFGFVLRGDVSIENEVYALAIGPQWKPEDGFSMSMYSISSIDVNDDYDTNYVYTGASFVMQYKY